MKEDKKTMVLLFLICLVLIPSFIYGASSRRIAQLQLEAGNKMLSNIQVTPKVLQLSVKADEKMLKDKLEVKAYYRLFKQPEVINNYDTNWEEIEHKEGKQDVCITYSSGGVTRKQYIAVNFDE